MRQKGKLTPLQYVEQLSWLLFLKLFDNLEEQKKLLNPQYESIFEPKYQWRNWIKAYSGEELLKFVDQDLIPYLASLTGTPQKAKISSIFKEIRNYMKSGYALGELVQLIDEIDFSQPEDSQILSIVYEELLLYTAGEKGGGAGEFYTPRPIIRFMIKIVQPQIGEKILDPFCGSAGFLVESYKYLRDQVKTLKDHNILQQETFYGQEAKAFPYLVGTMNCMLHGIESPNISFLELGTFAEDIRSIPEDRKFDIILTNPPFGGEEDKKLLSNFPIKTSDTELAGLYYCMRKLKTGGRCGIVQPEGVLFRTSGAYLQVKKELLQNFNLHTIISLPPGVFANVSPKGGSGPKTNLLFFEKGLPTKEIWYYELTPPNGKNYTKNNPIKDEHLEDAYKKWQKREISENSWIVKVEDIIKNEYDLSAKNPNRVKTIEYPKPEELYTSIAEKEK
ncbi:MAG: type I restriction-modification system subunit M, partial [candidate division WOR-3 bacterium]|nr:type I restriction-modification system subunit M [candidate division WOR-3 bacterium]